jgi:hypothetical protein
MGGARFYEAHGIGEFSRLRVGRTPCGAEDISENGVTFLVAKDASGGFWVCEDVLFMSAGKTSPGYPGGFELGEPSLPAN